MGCFGVNLVEFKQKQVEKQMRRCGLEPKQVELVGFEKTTIECWLPSSRGSKPALMLIHGFVLNAVLEWEFQLRPLCKIFDLYIPHLLFYGESTTASSERSEIFQAKCLFAMLQQLQVANFDIVGSSYGGFVGFWMAHFYPENVKRLVIADAGICMNPAADYDDLLKRFDATELHEVLMPRDIPRARRSIRAALYNVERFLPNCIVQDMLETVFNHDREARTELLDANSTWSKNPPKIPILAQNVLIIWGEHDGIFDVDFATRVQKHLGDKSGLEVIRGCAHAPQSEKPRLFNAAVLKFLETVTG